MSEPEGLFSISNVTLKEGRKENHDMICLQHARARLYIYKFLFYKNEL